jgi:hypothetical protein
MWCEKTRREGSGSGLSSDGKLRDPDGCPENGNFQIILDM